MHPDLSTSGEGGAGQGGKGRRHVGKEIKYLNEVECSSKNHWGNAGPTSDEGGKPVGLVYIGVAGPKGVVTSEHRYMGSRFAVRDRTTQQALVLLRDELLR